MTSGVNLVPDARQRARALRLRTRRWAVVAAVYGLVLMVACVALRLVGGGRGSAGGPQMTELESRIELARDSISQLRGELDEHELTLRINRDLIEHPDWGLLLGLLSKTLGQELVLRACQIEHVPRGDRGSDSDNAGLDNRYQLVLRGMGRTQAAVSLLVLRLEQLDLFEQVTLVDTNLEPFLSGKSVAFHVECHLGGGDR